MPDPTHAHPRRETTDAILHEPAPLLPCIDLHTKTIYACILDRDGQVLVHKNLPSNPEAFLELLSSMLRSGTPVRKSLMGRLLVLLPRVGLQPLHQPLEPL